MMHSTSSNMQRKPGFPVANCSIKMPDSLGFQEPGSHEEDNEQQQRRQQLINFGHAQWGFNNWSWAVTKQELDFAELTNGKYCAGVVAFVSVTVKSLDILRENIGYATSSANTKGFAIYKSRKCAVTNALRETLLSFGGNVATELLEILESTKTEPTPAQPEPENNQNLANKPTEPKNVIANKNIRKEENVSRATPSKIPPVANAVSNVQVPSVPTREPPVAKAHPMPASLPPAGRAARPPPPPAPPAPRPNSNVSFMVPVMGGMVPPYIPPRPHVQQIFPNYYEYPWPFAYEPFERHGNVNLNFNIPPKNLVVNSRAGSVECKGPCRPEDQQYHPQQGPGCWIKPTIFYDGFWTEQKVKKWVAEQVEKQFPEDGKVHGPEHSKC